MSKMSFQEKSMTCYYAQAVCIYATNGEVKMADKESTQEEIRTVMKWLGFTYEEFSSRYEHWWQWKSPNGEKGFINPPLDLNTLLTYIPPKLKELGYKMTIQWEGDAFYVVLISSSHGKFSSDINQKLHLALFRAVWKLMEPEPS